MKVRRIELLLIICGFLISGCAKTVDEVFGQGSDKPTPVDSCVAQAKIHNKFIQNRFLVTWEDGKITREQSETAELFKEKFIRPQLSKIKLVEFDQHITLNSEPSLVQTNSLDLYQWGQQITELDSVWAQNILGDGVKVGVVDAAVDYYHSQLRNQLAVNAGEVFGDHIDNDGNGFVDDLYGWDFYSDQPDPWNIISSENSHGSHVSGIILAEHTAGGMKGVAPKAKLVPANFMSPNGGGTLGAAIEALKYVAHRGVRVINASWGGSGCSNTLRQVIAGFAERNILVVVASGNAGKNLDIYPEYPAKYNLSNQITVAATRSTDFMTTFSNSSFTYVHIGAPGEQIFSTVPGGYAFMDGTSMAAPFVTGAAALLWSARPQASFAQIRQALLAGVDVKSYRVSTGGRLNVRKALQELYRLVP